MTEKTPPPGKIWVTFQTDTATWDDPYAFDPKALVGDVPVKVERGEPEEDPSDKCNRLLGEAEEKFRQADYTYPSGSPTQTGTYLAHGARLLAEALKVFREQL